MLKSARYQGGLLMMGDVVLRQLGEALLLFVSFLLIPSSLTRPVKRIGKAKQAKSHEAQKARKTPFSLQLATC